MKSTNNKQSLKFNILFNGLYELLIVLVPLITAPYVSRVLQPEGVGINSYTTSLLTYFSLCAGLGSVTYGKRTIASLRDNIERYSKAFWEIEVLTVATTGICLFCWILFSICYKQYRVYMLVLSFLLLSVLFDISWLYGGLEKFQYTVSVNSLFKIVSMICIFVFVRTSNDALRYTAILSLSALLGNLSMWLFLPKFIVKSKIELVSMKGHLKNTLAFFGPAIATSIYTVLDKTLIGIITQSASQNGYYEQATKIIDIVKSVCFNGINGVMMARASFLYSVNDKKGLSEIKDISLQLILFLSIGACFGLIGVADTFVLLFFGQGYEPVIILIRILAIVVVEISISSVANTLYYIAGGYMKQAFKLIVIGSLINLILNISLIPFLGSYGAAIATFVAELVITILFINGTKRFIEWKLIGNMIWKKIISGMVMLLVLSLLENLQSNIDAHLLLSFKVTIGIITYIFVLILLHDPTIKLFVNYIKKKRKRGV